MSTYKTKVESGTLDTFFKEHNIPVQNLETIGDGEVSQAYLFESLGKQKVLRINAHSKDGFQRDQFAEQHFSSPEIPIPKIDEIGELPNGHFYAISDRAPGVILDKLTAEEFKATLPSLIRTMEAIHNTPPAGDGYGTMKLDGSGKYTSWHESLDAQQAGDDDAILESIEMFEQTLYDKVRAKIKEYYRFCPNDIRQLVHMDYGFNNALAEDGQITGVIDWDNASYGDPLYDVAWLEFWAPAFNWSSGVDIGREMRQYYQTQGQLPDNYDERIDCYKMIIGANCMSFFAKSDQENSYKFVRGELLKLKPLETVQIS